MWFFGTDQLWDQMRQKHQSISDTQTFDNTFHIKPQNFLEKDSPTVDRQDQTQAQLLGNRVWAPLRDALWLTISSKNLQLF